MVDIIAQFSCPARAILFGSGASENFTNESDLDILLVFKTKKELEVAQKVVTGRPLSAWPIDFILKLEADFDRRKNVGGVCYEAVKSGKDLINE